MAGNRVFLFDKTDSNHRNDFVFWNVDDEADDSNWPASGSFELFTGGDICYCSFDIYGILDDTAMEDFENNLQAIDRVINELEAFREAYSAKRSVLEASIEKYKKEKAEKEEKEKS